MTVARRHWLLGGAVAAAAVAAGAGWSLWRQRGTAAGAGAQADLWSSSFDTPAGTRLAMADLRGQKLVLNFWAPWCPPCVREMPALDRFQRNFGPRGWRVVGLAADKLGPVREFLARAPVSFEIGLAGFTGIELSRRLGNEAGGLPFTLLFGRDGALRQRHSGETHYAQLAQWAEGID